MSIPLYFATNQKDFPKISGARPLTMGYGYNEEGELELPERLPDKTPLLLTDASIFTPSQEELDRIAALCGSGCILDFERTPQEAHRALLQGLRRRNIRLWVPPKYQQPGMAALCASPGVCNSWERFTEETRRRYGDGWCLELAPWHSFHIGCSLPAPMYSSRAVCRLIPQLGGILVCDTPETLLKKISLAEAHGCAAAVCLACEWPADPPVS